MSGGPPRAAAVALVVLVVWPVESLLGQVFVEDSAPRSVRAAGLAGASTAVVGDAGAIFGNPAALATIRGAAIEGGFAPGTGGVNLASGALAVRMGRFDWGFGAQTVASQPRGTAGDVLGVSALVIRYGMLAAGGAMKYVQQSTIAQPVHCWAGDAGITLAIFDIAALGASVQNLGGDFGNGTRLRRWTRLGLTMNYVDPQGTVRLLTTFEGRWPEGARAAFAAGVEGGIVQHGVGVVARLGVAGRAVPGRGGPVTAGATLELHGLHVDYAYQIADPGSNTRHQLGLRWAP